MMAIVISVESDQDLAGGPIIKKIVTHFSIKKYQVIK
jgi:hypothetical protein